MSTVGLHDSVRKRQPLAAREVAGEVVIMTGPDAKLHTLNETGSFLWSLLDSEHQVGVLLERLVEQFEVEQDVAQNDLFRFLGDLIDRKILEIVPSAPDTTAQG